jgi:hypothetical protein
VTPTYRCPLSNGEASAREASAARLRSSRLVGSSARITRQSEIGLAADLTLASSLAPSIIGQADQLRTLQPQSGCDDPKHGATTIRRHDGTHEATGRLIFAGKRGARKIWAAINNTWSRLAFRYERGFRTGWGPRHTGARALQASRGRARRHAMPLAPRNASGGHH